MNALKHIFKLFFTVWLYNLLTIVFVLGAFVMIIAIIFEGCGIHVIGN